MVRFRFLLLAILVTAVGNGCTANVKPIPPVAQVDLPRFMGDWYVIAHIPSPPERNVYNAVESYTLKPDGRVQTTFRYRDGGFDRPVETMHPVGTVRPGSGNAIWGMQFVWPIKAEYVIVYLEENYTQTIIGRSSRDYAWVMARTPSISEAYYQRHLERLRALGYAPEQVRRVPQAWPEPAAPP
ncbi:MAG: lipocalin family protein [Chromatiales bacterium]